MQLLQRLHINLAPLQRGDAFGGGAGRGQSSDRRDASGHGGTTDRLFVEVRILARWRVDYELNTVAFNEIDYVRTTFFHFVHAVASHAGSFDHIGGAGGGDKLESHVN